MMRSVIRLLAFSLVLLCSGTAGAQAPTQWIITSDIHFDALDDPALADKLAAAPIDAWDAIFASSAHPIAPYGSDTNARLFNAALAQMKVAAPDPQVVLIAGDFLAHTYRTKWNAAASDRSDAAFNAFLDKNMAYLAHAFNKTYPRAQFVITLGNNDSACGDYAIAPHSAFLAHTAQAWEPLVNRNGGAPNFARDFPADGDYVAALPNGTRVVAVNSNAWSPYEQTTCDPDSSAQREVMRWFEGAVAQAPSGAKTWALLHIPPGIDAFTSVRRNTPVSFYRPDLLARFRAVRAADGQPLGLILAGHLHNDGFRIVDQTPLLLVPSISPNHANNPSFFVATMDGANGAIADYQAYALNDSPVTTSIATAAAAPIAPQTFGPEYDFDAAYALNGPSLGGLQQLQTSIHDNAAIRDAQAEHYVAGSPIKIITPQTWHAYWCANTALDPDAYTACLSTN